MIRLKHQQKETSIFKGKSTFKLNFEDGSQQKETLRLYDMSSQDDSQIIRTHLYANPLIKGVAHHLLDQQEEVAPFQGSRNLSAPCGLARITILCASFHPPEKNPGRALFLFSKGLGARLRKELLSQAWDEKVKVDRPL